jgi:mitogen-activated protein kinase 15
MELDLHTAIQKKLLSKAHRKCIIYRISVALYKLHALGLMHRDVKPSNILLKSDCTTKLCDFGLSRSSFERFTVSDPDQEIRPEKKFSDSEEALSEYVVTRYYRAPELLLGCDGTYTSAIDMWALGCVIAEIHTGKFIFCGKNNSDQIYCISKLLGKPSKEDFLGMNVPETNLPVFDESFSTPRSARKSELAVYLSLQLVPSLAIDLIEKLLVYNPSKRLSALEVMKHPYVEQFYNAADAIVSGGRVFIDVPAKAIVSRDSIRELVYQAIGEEIYNEHL